MNFLHFNQIFTQRLLNFHLAEKRSQLDILRLDELHPVVSGNKWFKLKYYLKDASLNGFGKIATFGGAYSNHILPLHLPVKKREWKALELFVEKNQSNGLRLC
jgi:1-aminocyclopropane-1-carboxylate deaminase/D-cysteine desulfhydrase-like pyridoxal-dependent ACC family enzyme